MSNINLDTVQNYVPIKGATALSLPPHMAAKVEEMLPPLQVTADRVANRVQFKPIPTGVGVYARMHSAVQGLITSIAVMPRDETPAGTLYISTIDPAVSYDGAFLNIVCEDIPIKTEGRSMWRKTDVYSSGFSTLQANRGFLYLIILGGPSGEFIADVALTAITD